MRYPSTTRLLIIFCFICRVALCQYIEATKFRDGARGKLASANEGNRPTTHTPFPSFLELSFEPFNLKPDAPCFFFCFFFSATLFSSETFFLLLISCTDGDLPFPVLCNVDFSPPGIHFSPPLCYLPSSSSSWTKSWCLTITASVSHTQIQCCLHWHCLVNVYSPPTLWITFFSVLPWYVHHFCFNLGWEQLLVRFYNWLISASLCTAIKAVLKHVVPKG